MFFFPSIFIFDGREGYFKSGPMCLRFEMKGVFGLNYVYGFGAACDGCAAFIRAVATRPCLFNRGCGEHHTRRHLSFSVIAQKDWKRLTWCHHDG